MLFIVETQPSMKRKVLNATVALLIAIAISFSAVVGQALAGNFSLTCYDTNLSGSVLTSTCEEADGYTLNSSSIDLNPYIENIDGNLQWQPGNYWETCDSMEVIDSSIMSGYCKTRAQYWNQTGIDLDDHISNINGVLMYE